MTSKQLDVKNQLCLGVYCSVQPRPLAIDFDSGLVNCNPLRLRLTGYDRCQPANVPIAKKVDNNVQYRAIEEFLLSL